MIINDFFDLFLEELKHHDKLREYYKFHEDPAKLPFRKAYFSQRLQYVLDRVSEEAPGFGGRPAIWDVGSGYSTTQIFLALNGYRSHGSTLEFYFAHLPQRFEFWSKYGDMNLVGVGYENLFEHPVPEASKDIIIVQDTLHHLEPLADSLRIFYRSLRPGGVVVAVEENGNNLMQRLKLYRQRGNNRIIEYYDEGLGRMVLMGNENIRPYRTWRREFEQAGFVLDDALTQYVRLFPPGYFAGKPLEMVVDKEQAHWRKHPLLKEYFFFGVNFLGRKI